MWRYKNPYANFGDHPDALSEDYDERSEGTVDLAPKVLESNARPLESGRIVGQLNNNDIPSTTTIQFSG